MKGIVFTEFMEMVEEKFSPEVLDAVIDDSGVPNGGAYTAVGTYDHREMVSLVTALSSHSGIAVPDLLRSFGHHLAATFARSHPSFFRTDGLFTFLESVEHHVHVEVRKLYPDAELPAFETRRVPPATLEVTYRSSRSMGDLAFGLIEAAALHFQEPVDIAREDCSGGRGTEILFTITKRA